MGSEGWGARRVGGPKGGAQKGGAPKGGAPKGGGPEGWGPEGVGAQTQKKWGPEGWGPEGWSPEGWSPERWSPEGWGAQNFALFSLSRQKIRSFPLWGSSRGILVVFLKAGTLKCARLEFSGCRVRVPVARSGGAAGVPHDNQSPNVHILGLRPSKTPPKFNEKTPRETQKERILLREREKKERNFGRSRGRAVQGKGGPRGRAVLETNTHT